MFFFNIKLQLLLYVYLFNVIKGVRQTVSHFYCFFFILDYSFQSLAQAERSFADTRWYSWCHTV